jgi:hypothetical protein
MSIFIKGEDRILSIGFEGVFYPIGCLSDNSFSENSEMLDTTTRESNGWATAQAVKQNYNISFNGLQINTTVSGGDTSKFSYDTLKQIKRNREKIQWKIQGTQVPSIDYGFCTINEISESTPVNEFITFTGNLLGFGQPFFAANANDPVFVEFENNDLQILQNNDNYTYR